MHFISRWKKTPLNLVLLTDSSTVCYTQLSKSSSGSRIRAYSFVAMLLFFSSNASLGSPLFVLQNSQAKVHSICESSSCQLKQQTKDCALLIGWARGLSFTFNKTVLRDYLSKHRQSVRKSSAGAFVFINKIGPSKRNICFMRSRIKAKCPSLNTDNIRYSLKIVLSEL